MARQPKFYRQLPGRGRSWVAHYRLYQAPDHLLQAASTGYSETYKRFYFRDIQAITVQKSNRRSILNWVLGIPAALGLVIWASVVLSLPAITTGEIIGGLVVLTVLGAPLLINSALGPTCLAYIHTAVQTERLWPLSRLRKAQKTLTRLRPLIEAAQGQLRPEDLQKPPAAFHPAPSPQVMAPSPQPSAPATASTPYDGKRHLLLCWLLLADVPCTALGLVWNSKLTESVGMLLLGAITIVAIVAILKQRQSGLPKGLKRIPWLAIGAGVFSLVFGICYGVVLAVTGRAESVLTMGLSPLTDPWVLAMTILTTGFSAVLGGTGLILLQQYRHALAIASPPAGGELPVR